MTVEWIAPAAMYQIDEQVQQATQYPATLLYAQQQIESGGPQGFGENIISSAGAIGVSQFEPATAEAFGVDPYNPLSSAMGQAHYMQQLYAQNNGNIVGALNAYNGNGAGDTPTPYSTDILDKVNSSTVSGIALPPPGESLPPPSSSSSSSSSTIPSFSQGAGWSTLGMIIILIIALAGIVLVIFSLADSKPAQATVKNVKRAAGYASLVM